MSLKKVKKRQGTCDWKKGEIRFYPSTMWQTVLIVEGRLFKPAPGSEEFEDPFEILNPDRRLAYSEELVTVTKHNLFVTVLGNTLFHEYMHQFLLENRIHPWTCNNCAEGKCKLCRLTGELLDTFYPE